MATDILRDGGRRGCGPGSVFGLFSSRTAAILLLAAVIILLVGNVHAEHDNQTFTFPFSGITGSLGNDMQEFVIHNDGAFYVKLKSYVPASPTTYKPRIGFNHPGQFLCPARYVSYIDDPTLGTSYGPYYMEAETYNSYFYLNSPGVSYSLEIEYRRQLVPNDKEPNDTSAQAEDLGNLSPGASITGHLGYLGCVHDLWDYRRFGVTASGSYLFDIRFDSPFREKAGCQVYVHLYDETAGTWVLSHTGPQNADDLGPKQLEAGHTYRMSLQASGCYETIYDGGGTFRVNNKAGAYEVTFTGQAPPTADPFTVTDLTVKPTTLWPGETLNGKVFVQNNKNTPSGKIELSLQVVRLSGNVQEAAKEYALYLAASELKIFEFSLGLLLAPKKITDLAGGRYRIVATARTRDGSGNVTHSSSREVEFNLNPNDKTLTPIIDFIILKKKKE
ncbi:MAG TPA: hypothetical protein DDY20_05035 [Desulfobulbaceae bacterium]|nr:hypothetical protein [Desulfobulbaceae bacterium]